MTGLNWRKLTLVALEGENGSIVEVSGSHLDGFSVQYTEYGNNGKLKDHGVMKNPPQKIIPLIEVLWFVQKREGSIKKKYDWEKRSSD